MIAVSLKDGEDMVDLLLSKGADVNMKSELFETASLKASLRHLLIIYSAKIPMVK